MADVYVLWPIPKLKNELSRRGATTTGRKTDLIERLRAYDRNANFRGVPVNLPEPLEPQWPLTGFQQLRPEHKIMLPKLTTEQIEGYFLYRMAEDRQASGDIKALEKGKKMFESHRILACSFYQSGQNTFLSGIVGAAMRHKVPLNKKFRKLTHYIIYFTTRGI
ncbi:uncharacterized protein [Mytilus edulis]|uniref:uncharacterized protein n=1 Tax=Mytilus edulis TaxID=6550 RepID=UPI0039F0D454